ncbi:hypothetical protein M5689_018123 [Euphorbia peplus]|nr:hypothetical protein M5689_018123 [Euphorbia peplus]
MNINRGGDGVDHCVWTGSCSGIFNVKDFYFSMENNAARAPWCKFIWSDVIPPSRSMVCWRFLLGYIPTRDQLQKRGMTLVSRCILCNSASESIDHIMVHCSFSQIAWRSLGALFGNSILLTNTLFTLLSNCMINSFSSQVGNLWSVGL